jgi:hypothetical protein
MPNELERMWQEAAILGSIPEFSWMNWGKQWIALLRSVPVMDKVRPRQSQKKSQRRYWLNQFPRWAAVYLYQKILFLLYEMPFICSLCNLFFQHNVFAVGSTWDRPCSEGVETSTLKAFKTLKWLNYSNISVVSVEKRNSEAGRQH